MTRIDFIKKLSIVIISAICGYTITAHTTRTLYMVRIVLAPIAVMFSYFILLDKRVQDITTRKYKLYKYITWLTFMVAYVLFLYLLNQVLQKETPNPIVAGYSGIILICFALYCLYHTYSFGIKEPHIITKTQDNGAS